MKKFLLVLVLTIMPLCNAHATTTYGAGGASCGNWVKVSKEGGSDYAFSLSWVHGYLSALQINYSLKEVDNSSIRLFLDKYCTENPFDNLSQAAHKLSLELL